MAIMGKRANFIFAGPKTATAAAAASTYRDFAENTSIHGIKYTVNKRMAVWERLFWATVLVFCFVGAVYMVLLFWDRFTSNPTRTSIVSAHMSTNSIPFPAVTICNLNRIMRTKVDAFVNKLDLYGATKKDLKRAIYQLAAYSSMADYNTTDLMMLKSVLDLNEFTNIHAIFRRITQNCKEMIIKCRWESTTIDCADIFIESLTLNGICCSFNYNPEMKIRKKKYTKYFGLQMGLSLLLDPRVEDSVNVTSRRTGMEVLMHNSEDYPGTRAAKKILAIGRETMLQITAKRLYCSATVKALTPAQRKCIYSTEKSLKYFRKYGDSNCVEECRFSTIIEECDCVPYNFMVLGKEVCNISKIPCINHQIRSLTLNSTTVCDCPSKCENVFYSLITTSSKFINYQFATSSFLEGVNTTDDHMLMHVYFASEFQTILQRETITSTLYLLSSFGGIFSLFLGCSFISGAEMLYYLLVRLPLSANVLNKIDDEVGWKEIDGDKLKREKRLEATVSHGFNVNIIYDKNVFVN